MNQKIRKVNKRVERADLVTMDVNWSVTAVTP